jgi:hypothetical protein
VHEGSDDAVRIVVTRTGGGFGTVSVTYSLRHVSSDASDVAATAHYTTDQTLTFPHGVVQVRTPLLIMESLRDKAQCRPLLSVPQSLNMPSSLSPCSVYCVLHAPLPPLDASPSYPVRRSPSWCARRTTAC